MNAFNFNVIASEIENAASLEALHTALLAFDAFCAEHELDAQNELLGWGVNATDLPTFGGIEPANTDGIWSWDATRILTGACWSDITIETRA